MQRFLFLQCAMVLAVNVAVGAAEEGMIRIGDPGSVFDESRYDPAYPDSKEWAKAGVQGGIPYRNQTPVVARVAPGQSIQAAIDKAGGRPGVVLLGRGVHPITERLRMQSNVIVRGEDRDTTIISYDIGTDTGSGLGTCVLFRKVERAALEDLTLQHARVKDLDHDAYHRKWENHADWPSGDNATIEMSKATNCWVQHCKIIDNVNRPVRIWGGSSHVTMRDNITDYAVNRGGQGSSYYEVVHATYVLMYNETVSRIRHVCLNGKIDYCVLVHCDLAVDVNWHCIPPMSKSLVTNCRSRAREVGHRWPAFCHYRDPVPTDNLIYKFSPGYDDGKVYCTEHPGKPFIKDTGKAPPIHGTLYPVTGRHIPYETIARGNVLKRLAEAEQVGNWPAVQACVKRLRAVGGNDRDETQRLNDLMERANAQAEDQLEGLLRGNQADRLREFVKTWPHAACRDRASEKLESLGRDALAKLRKRHWARGKEWAQFIKTWSGCDVADEAQQEYEKKANEELAEFRKRYRPENRASWLRAAMRLLQEWPATEAAAAVDRDVCAIIDPALEQILAQENKRLRFQQLRAFVHNFGPTSAGKRALAELKTMNR